MENELRYYIRVIKDAMQPLTEEEINEVVSFNANCEPENQIEVRKKFSPTHLVTAVQLPTGAIELAINTSNIEEKLDYIVTAYDETMHLKTNPEICMLNLLVV